MYVNTVPAQRQSEYLAEIINMISASTGNGISSIERPALICVFSQCKKRDEPFDIDICTEQLLTFMEKGAQLLGTKKTFEIEFWSFT